MLKEAVSGVHGNCAKHNQPDLLNTDIQEFLPHCLPTVNIVTM